MHLFWSLKELKNCSQYNVSSMQIYQCFYFCVAAKKTNKQVYVSYSLPVTDPNMSLLVESTIKKELELHPEHF